MEKTINELICEIINAFRCKKCWYASCGGVAGATFALALGRKIRRINPLKNKSHSDDYRQYEGEVNLYVWCTWRLDSKEGPITSSDDSKKGIAKALDQLLGKKVTDIRVDIPCWDLHVMFSDGLSLHVFCDHLQNKPSFDGNWEVWLRQKAVFFGPGSKHEIQIRKSKKGNRVMT
jgi:hypothetical protein